MHLLQAEIRDFRNFEQAQLRPGQELSALLGDNGQGKTNALEALYLLAALRPLRSVKRRALIREGAKRATIVAHVLSRVTGLTHKLELTLEAGQRTLRKDDKTVSAQEFLGTFVAVAFTPDDLQLAKGGPDDRRRFLDRALLNAKPSYLSLALRYAKALKDRNRLLATDGSDEEVAVFETLLSEIGAQVIEARQALVHRIAPEVQKQFREIADPAPSLKLSYKCSVPSGPEDTQTRFAMALAERRPSDRRRSITSVGPHRDDLLLELEGEQAKDRASQGQHRALVLALKLVEIQDLGQALGEAPVLLLDDMSSELDAHRTRQLFGLVRALEGQVILTSTVTSEALVQALGHPATTQVVRSGVIESPTHPG